MRAERPYQGFLVPAFHARTLAGDTVTVGASSPGGTQLLFFFTTTCPFCLETLPAWKRIAEEVQTVGRGAVRVYGVSLSAEGETRDYARVHGLPFPVVFFPEPRLERLYRVLGVPFTVVLGSGGVMRHVRFGSLAGSSAAVDSVLCAARALVEGEESCG